MNATTTNNISIDVGRGAIFYDDGCGFCAGVAHRLGPALERRGFKLIGLHSETALQLTGATLDDLMRELYVAAPDRTTYRGVDSILFILSAWPWLRPVCAIARWPGINAMLRFGYAIFARNRYRVSNACSIRVAPRDSNTRRIVRWLPMFLLPIATLIFARPLPAWAYMLSIAIAIFYACKWLTLLSPPAACGVADQDACVNRSAKPQAAGGLLRALGYLFLWTGMDARSFMGPRDAAAPARREWSVVGIKMLIGAAMLWLVPHWIASELIRAWCMMIGLVLLAHFGVFHLIALIWQSNGVHATPVMNEPLRSESLGDLWGRRWNTAFVQLASQYVYEPLRRRFNAIVALIATFLVSGLVHDIAISIPARGGYGFPTLYFLIQCAGLLVQHSRVVRRAGFSRGVRGWLITTVVALVPLPLLFHTPFVMEVMKPMLDAIFTLPRVLIANLPLLLMLAGVTHLCITSAGVVMTLVLDWRRSLASLNGLTRHIIWTHGGFVLATIVGFGIVSLVQPTELSSGVPLARAICAFIALFWGARLVIGFTIFDAKPFLTSRALALGYYGLNVVIAYFVLVYGLPAVVS